VKVAARFRTRYFVIGLVGSVVAALIVIASIGRFIGFTRVGDTLEGADPKWLGVCVAGQVLVFVGYANAMRLAFGVESGTELPIRASIRLALASFAATQLFAFAGIGGLALVYVALRRTGRDRRSAATTLVGLNTSVYFVFAVIAFMGSAGALALAQAPLSMTLPWVIGVPVVLLVARWFTNAARRDRASALDTGALQQALATGIAAAAWARDRLVHRDGRSLLGWAACYWFGDLCSMWAALHAFGAEPALTALVTAYTAGYIVQVLPVPLIATAGVDAATTLLLHVVGVPLDIALVGVVAHRVFAFWLPIVPGSLYALGLARERNPHAGGDGRERHEVASVRLTVGFSEIALTERDPLMAGTAEPSPPGRKPRSDETHG
jgi:uncharacterized membrane protein YbhN (UPF0104 family)